VLRKEFMMSAN